MNIELCCFDGISDCQKAEACDKCMQDEMEWNESWSQWLRSGSHKRPAGEVVGAASG
jgi:hypothetical protein